MLESLYGNRQEAQLSEFISTKKSVHFQFHKESDFAKKCKVHSFSCEGSDY